MLYRVSSLASPSSRPVYIEAVNASIAAEKFSYNHLPTELSGDVGILVVNVKSGHIQKYRAKRVWHVTREWKTNDGNQRHRTSAS